MKLTKLKASSPIGRHKTVGLKEGKEMVHMMSTPFSATIIALLLSLSLVLANATPAFAHQLDDDSKAKASLDTDGVGTVSTPSSQQQQPETMAAIGDAEDVDEEEFQQHLTVLGH